MYFHELEVIKAGECWQTRHSLKYCREYQKQNKTKKQNEPKQIKNKNKNKTKQNNDNNNLPRVLIFGNSVLNVSR